MTKNQLYAVNQAFEFSMYILNLTVLLKVYIK